MTSRTITNFGANLRFTPKHLYAPRTDQEVLEILANHRAGQIRVMGSRHSWSGAIESADALVDLRHFAYVRVAPGDVPSVTVGAGCRIKDLLSALEREGLTTPSVGLITEQTIAGAISTGTHGSGRQSLSHFIESLRIACYSGAGGAPEIRTVTGGDELRAARCALGTLGVILDVTLRAVPRYFVRERLGPVPSLDEVLASEAEHPLQQFYLIPHSWTYMVQRRAVAEVSARSPSAPLYRLYWLTNLDIGLHLLIKLFAAVLRSRTLVHLLFRRILPALNASRWEVTDRSDRQLVMEHELFRHLETELFVPASRLAEALTYLREVLTLADDATRPVPPDLQSQVDGIGMRDDLERIRGGYSHHYPICVRRVLEDDTLISMAAGGGTWYALSLITYTEPRDPFYTLATFLARSMARLHEARPHWGKWFPLDRDEVRPLYSGLGRFESVRAAFDPRGVFLNRYTREVLGPGDATGREATGSAENANAHASIPRA